MASLYNGRRDGSKRPPNWDQDRRLRRAIFAPCTLHLAEIRRAQPILARWRAPLSSPRLTLVVAVFFVAVAVAVIVVIGLVVSVVCIVGDLLQQPRDSGHRVLQLLNARVQPV